ncbi:MAG TPA: winged helix-turn-helix domain-containing protein, partial [Xanthomonadales bacterium]|nr:winged helix-turn-helix domain-containing protein [Xanthomonadales bacterium]
MHGGPAGILESYVRRRVLRERATSVAPRLSVELLAGRMLRDGFPVRLSDKELELVALLGSAHTPLSRDRIGEALWDHLDPEEWANNLKVTLSRLRAKLAMRDAVLLVDGRYRLSPVIDVDVRRAESALRDSVGKRLDDVKRAELAEIVDASRSGAFGRYDRSAWAQPLLTRIEDLFCRAGVLLA